MTATGEPLLRVEQVSVTYPDHARTAPTAASFSVHPGEVVLVLGPSGCGKSTLTLTLNGLVPQSVPSTVTGHVTVAGLDVATVPVPRVSEQVAMVFQDPDAQVVTSSVLDEVAFGLENLRLPVDAVLHRSETALRRMGLWERRDDNPDDLSGGGRQRLGIACAIAMGSPLVVLDEPTANLDPRGVLDVYDAIADLVADGERAVILVEHNLDAAMHFATRAIVLDATGAVAFDGPADTVLRDNVDALLAMGVWLPQATLAALRLRDAGVAIDPLPLTADALGSALLDASPPDATPDAAVRATGADNAPGAVVAAPREPAVVVRGLTVRRGRTVLLDNVSLDIPAGSFTAVLGANGAGKTTLVQALAGVARVKRGMVTVCGMDVATASARHLTSRIGFVFQNPEHQFVTYTVADELRLGAGAEAEVDDMLARFGLTEHRDTHPFRLSGGEKRRLSVGAALIRKPDALVLDEPTFGQDRARAAELLALLDELRRAGTTVIVVSHDLDLVAEHATHAVLMAAGQVVDFGATDTLMDAASLARVDLPASAVFSAVPPTLRPLLWGGVR